MAKLSIGSNVRALRKAKRLTQADLAAKAGVSYRGLQDIEGGHSNPTVETLLAIATTLGTTLAAICGEPGHAKAAKATVHAPGTGLRIAQHGPKREVSEPPSFAAAAAFLALYESLKPVRKALVASLIFDDSSFLGHSPVLARAVSSLLEDE